MSILGSNTLKPQALSIREDRKMRSRPTLGIRGCWLVLLPPKEEVVSSNLAGRTTFHLSDDVKKGSQCDPLNICLQGISS